MRNSIIIAIVVISIQAFGQSTEQKSVTTQEKTEKVTLKISGMTCSGCAKHIHKALTELKGIVDNEVRYPGDIAVVTYQPGEIKVEEIIRAIEKSGYKAKKLKSKS